MSGPFILGEFRRALDDRYRLSIPSEMADLLTGTAKSASWPKSEREP